MQEDDEVASKEVFGYNNVVRILEVENLEVNILEGGASIEVFVDRNNYLVDILVEWVDNLVVLVGNLVELMDIPVVDIPVVDTPVVDTPVVVPCFHVVEDIDLYVEM